MAQLPQIDVCLATYNRPDLLRKLIFSLLNQETKNQFRYTINIADNDHLGSARKIVEEFRGANVPINYIIQPEKNIALTRNASIALADGDFVAILDDDQFAQPEWLSEYFTCIQLLDCDVLHGPTDYYFDGPCSRLLKECKEFRRFERPTGVDSGYCRRSGNCFFRRSLLDDLGQWFDKKYGLTGGEDSDFFERLGTTGARFAWCSSAVTHEFVPKSRASLRWLFRRLFIHGMNFSERSRAQLGQTANHRRGKALRAKARRHAWLAFKATLKLDRLAAFDELLSLTYTLGYLYNVYTRKVSQPYLTN